ncbi:unnamed protein product [Natator depressus]
MDSPSSYTCLPPVAPGTFSGLQEVRSAAKVFSERLQYSLCLWVASMIDVTWRENRASDVQLSLLLADKIKTQFDFETLGVISTYLENKICLFTMSYVLVLMS